MTSYSRKPQSNKDKKNLRIGGKNRQILNAGITVRLKAGFSIARMKPRYKINVLRKSVKLELYPQKK